MSLVPQNVFGHPIVFGPPTMAAAEVDFNDRMEHSLQYMVFYSCMRKKAGEETFVLPLYLIEATASKGVFLKV